jgi:hypothetical protein
VRWAFLISLTLRSLIRYTQTRPSEIRAAMGRKEGQRWCLASGPRKDGGRDGENFIDQSFQ